jgi:hypothetical protein
MTQIDVSLTDYGVALECGWFAYVAGRSSKSDSLPRLAFATFFLSVALAALIGGTVHGFFLDERSIGYRVLWPSTLIAVGITALSGVYIGSALHFSGAAALYVKRFGLVFFAMYVLVVLIVRRDFLVAIVDYVPSLVFMGSAFLLSYRRRKTQALLIGFSGVCTMLLAAVLQQARVGINDRYFGYNALYHVLQALALWMIFVAAQESYVSEELSK